MASKSVGDRGLSLRIKIDGKLRQLVSNEDK
jgi:hypothetical protein